MGEHAVSVEPIKKVGGAPGSSQMHRPFASRKEVNSCRKEVTSCTTQQGIELGSGLRCPAARIRAPLPTSSFPPDSVASKECNAKRPGCQLSRRRCAASPLKSERCTRGPPDAPRRQGMHERGLELRCQQRIYYKATGTSTPVRLRCAASYFAPQASAKKNGPEVGPARRTLRRTTM